MKKEKPNPATKSKRNLRNRRGAVRDLTLIRKSNGHPDHLNKPNVQAAATIEKCSESRFETKFGLTAFEVIVMQRIANGAENNLLAKVYNMSTDCIEYYRKQIIKKTGAAHITEAIANGLRNKIIE